MEHPVAGIVGDESNFDLLPRRYQHRVLPFTVRCGLAIACDYPEGMAVQMDRMVPWR